MFDQGEIKFSEISGFLENNSKKVSTSSIAGWSAPYKMPNELNDQGASIGLLAPEGSTFKTYRFSEFRGIVKATPPNITSDSIINIETNSREFNFSYQIVADNMIGDINYPFLYIAINYPAGLTFNSNTGLLQGTINLGDLGYSAGDDIEIAFTVFADNYAGRESMEVTVNVEWNEPPTITVIGSSFVQNFNGVPYNDAGATANDPEDGDLTSSIITTSNVNTNVNGVYEVSYQVTDSGGLTSSVSRTVVVINNLPVISLLGNPIVNAPQGSTYIDAGAVAFDKDDGDITNRITIENTVDTSILNNYSVVYSVTDFDGGFSAVSRSVNVFNICSIAQENGDSLNAEDNQTIDVELCPDFCSLLQEDEFPIYTEDGVYLDIETCGESIEIDLCSLLRENGTQINTEGGETLEVEIC